MTKLTKPERCPAPTDDFGHLTRAMRSIEKGTLDAQLFGAAQKVIHTTVAHMERDARDFPNAATGQQANKKERYASIAKALDDALAKNSFGDKGALLEDLKAFMKEHQATLGVAQRGCTATVAEARER